MQINSDFEFLIKLVVIGDTGVGKTNFIFQFTEGKFSPIHVATIGFDHKSKIINLSNTKKKIKLQIWDTAGQERYRSITSSYYKGSHGCFIVYDITNESSFENVDKWYEQAQKEASKDVSIVLVGNKCDLENDRKISKEKGEEKAKNFNCPFFETSALSKIKIEDIFTEMVNNIYERTGGVKNEEDDDIEIINENDKAVNLNAEKPKEKKGCC